MLGRNGNGRCPYPKVPLKNQDMKNIMLMEAWLIKWTGLIVKMIVNSLQSYGVLSLSQHGYLPKRGSDSGNCSLFNTQELAWDDQERSLYGCSWDMNVKTTYSAVLVKTRVPLAIAQ